MTRNNAQQCTVCGVSPVTARGLCGKHYARLRTRGTTELPGVKENPGWGHGAPGEGRWWTKRRIVLALRRYAEDIPGPLTTSDHEWSEIKKGRLDLPPSQRILELWHSMARAWLVVGVDADRVDMTNTRWSKAEIRFLLEHAGELKLTEIAKRLNRSYAAVRTKLGAKGLGLKARENQGWLSASRIAKEYGAPYSRVCQMLAEGVLKGEHDSKRNSWRVDPMEAERLRDVLSAPKTRSYKTTPPDVGDYYDRYGIKRTVQEGRVVRIQALPKIDSTSPSSREKVSA